MSDHDLIFREKVIEAIKDYLLDMSVPDGKLLQWDLEQIIDAIPAVSISDLGQGTGVADAKDIETKAYQEWHPHELGGFTWKSKTSRN